MRGSGAQRGGAPAGREGTAMGKATTRGLRAVMAAALMVLVAGACEDPYAANRQASRDYAAKAAAKAEAAKADAAKADDTESKTIESTGGKTDDGSSRGKIEIKATDYAFDVPSSFVGGLVDLTLVNAGKEPHFAAFAQPKEGVTLETVRAALTGGAEGAAGPPPFVEFAALGTVDPGGTSYMTMNLPAGEYVLFCALPAASDGAPHMLKGMLNDVKVASGVSRGLPATDSTLTVADFAIGGPLKFKAGTNTVTLENRGKQIHEVDLVELPEGKTVADVKAWAVKLAGPPPAHFLGGPAVRDGLSVTSKFEMKPGARYAFVCIVPDSLSDFAAHITKGMATVEFEVEP